MIDEKNLERYIQKFSFPRRYGSNLEKLAFEKIQQEINKLDLKTEKQSFIFTTFYSNIILKLLVLLILCPLILKYLNTPNEIFFLFLGFTFLFGFLLFLISRKPENIRLGKKLSSQNLFVKMNSEEEKENEGNDRKNILFIAHVDSKGQTISITYRILSYNLWIITLLLLIIVFFLRFLYYEQFFGYFQFIASILMIINLISCVLILTNISNNKSPGALDNASGIAIILELLTHFKREGIYPKKCNFWFIFTGAEEVGTMGMRYFLNDLQIYDKEKFIILNFDAIGKKIDLFEFGQDKNERLEFIDFIFESSQELNIKIKKRNVKFGVHSDAWISAKKGFRGLSFGDIGSYKYLHSKKDTIDKVNYKILENLCQVITLSLKKLDEN